MNKADCIFCKIANGEIPSATIYEDEDFRVILDLAPISKGHALIMPKSHFDNVSSLDAPISAKILPLASKIGNAAMAALGAAGFNLLQNNGQAAGQTVFHFHMHVIPRYDDGHIDWTPGEAEPDELQMIAKMVREVL